jgi:hypothetical protein
VRKVKDDLRDLATEAKIREMLSEFMKEAKGQLAAEG